ncbi:RNA-directed DNA polymerase from mobile element jockey-like [Elysia marginata]|uniref:RNA-directed DNA polymerase from mobile element jockey-like n=1 Tax=Elysia marginata TaxID=1093978 RepID=A0AAV4GMH9_9GAST|nr:RNA-directed DNA polymerase from mobile element jockey-like [Elysia marginata]
MQSYWDWDSRRIGVRLGMIIPGDQTSPGPKPPLIMKKTIHDNFSIATYAREPVQVIDLGGNTEINETQRSCIKIADTEVHNIYKPPILNRDSPPVQVVKHSETVMGDFNSHHTEWGYQDDKKAGNDVSQWAGQSNATFLYNPKDKGTFKSARWRKEYTPDLAFLKENSKGSAQATR